MKQDTYMRMFKIVLSWMLVLCIPLSALGIAGNLVTRMPDIYQYAMNSTETFNEIDDTIAEADIAAAISKYMTMRADKIEVKISEEGGKTDLFDAADNDAVSKYRHVMNITMVVTIVSSIIAVGTYMLLLSHGNNEILRIRFKWAWGAYFGFLVIFGLVMLVPMFRINAAGFLFDGRLQMEGILQQIFCTGISQSMLLCLGFLSFAIMLILTSLTWSLTKPKGIFGKY